MCLGVFAVFPGTTTLERLLLHHKMLITLKSVQSLRHRYLNNIRETNMRTEADYKLPERFIKKVAKEMGEFRPGGTMLSVKLKDGTVISELIVSNCTWFMAHPYLEDIPFNVSEIEKVFQAKEEEWPTQPKEGWIFWKAGCRAAGMTRFIK